ncbi:histidine phosphatase family protein [Flammeovirga sp. SubArs3]|uniref:SixA phosphatase family protein n=1 Tax=Flammeovirga sp. SubArs3 TaxID=2995316 RepID=UPI00248B23BA|nr:histidine phosphatase family protein [Flammeovirga sp. SubArs3]
MRHAKSSWKNPLLTDFDRPLNKRGEKDLVKMADVLFEHKLMPDLIISSPAKRTKLTAEKVAETLSKQLHFEKDFYNALHDEILDVIKYLDENLETVMLVFHNPAITDLRNHFLSDYIENIPTAGVVAIEFKEADSWKELTKGEELFYEYPKKYFS